MKGLKRLNAESAWDLPLDRLVTEPDIGASRKSIVKDFRNQLYLWFTSGVIDAKTLAVVAWYVTALGCDGLGDLSVSPKQASKHASEHVNLVLAKDYPNPDLDMCKTVLYDKTSCQRLFEDVPVRLPSKIFSEEFSKHDDQSMGDVEPESTSKSYECQAYRDHPVTLLGKAKSLHWSRVVPGVLYIDGVQFTKNDSFHGLFLRNQRSGYSHLLCLLRSSLSFRITL